MISTYVATGLLALAGRWADTSQQRALANARAAAVECSRALVERAEVEAYLEALYRPSGDLTAEAEAASR